MRHLTAVLLNPPVTSGRSTLRALQAAAVVLECDTISAVNLFALPTQTVAEINIAGSVEEGWIEARPTLKRAVEQPGEILVGWGVSGLYGPAKRHFIEQVNWLTQLDPLQGRVAWSVGPQPRHPSRWHQYVSDRYGRTSGGSFVERLEQILTSAPLVTHRRSGDQIPAVPRG